MKINLAIWTAVDGYDWQPGSIYSPKELADFKDEIGPLVPDSLPIGGLFLKGGTVVFYRVQIADRMDSHGRGAIYCVLGTLPEDKAGDVDFSVVFNSPEMAVPKKPFPLSIDYQGGPSTHNTSLGRDGFSERRFNGTDTFCELGGWCNEAKAGKLKVRITGTMDAPLFVVDYKPHVEPVVEPPKPPPQPFYMAASEQQQPPSSLHLHKRVSTSPSSWPEPEMPNQQNRASMSASTALARPQDGLKAFCSGAILGFVGGVFLTALVVWLWPSTKVEKSPDGTASVLSMKGDDAVNVRKQKEHKDGDVRIPSDDGRRSDAMNESPKNQWYKCPGCKGAGRVRSFRGYVTCTECNGMGKVAMP